MKTEIEDRRPQFLPNFSYLVVKDQRQIFFIGFYSNSFQPAGLE